MAAAEGAEGIKRQRKKPGPLGIKQCDSGGDGQAAEGARGQLGAASCTALVAAREDNRLGVLQAHAAALLLAGDLTLGLCDLALDQQVADLQYRRGPRHPRG